MLSRSSLITDLAFHVAVLVSGPFLRSMRFAELWWRHRNGVQGVRLHNLCRLLGLLRDW